MAKAAIVVSEISTPVSTKYKINNLINYMCKTYILNPLLSIINSGPVVKLPTTRAFELQSIPEERYGMPPLIVKALHPLLKWMQQIRFLFPKHLDELLHHYYCTLS